MWKGPLNASKRVKVNSWLLAAYCYFAWFNGKFVYTLILVFFFFWKTNGKIWLQLRFSSLCITIFLIHEKNKQSSARMRTFFLSSCCKSVCFNTAMLWQNPCQNHLHPKHEIELISSNRQKWIWWLMAIKLSPNQNGTFITWIRKKLEKF